MPQASSTTVSGNAGYNGDNIAATAAMPDNITGVTVDRAENIFIANKSNNLIRKPPTVITCVLQQECENL